MTNNFTLHIYIDLLVIHLFIFKVSLFFLTMSKPSYVCDELQIWYLLNVSVEKASQESSGKMVDSWRNCCLIIIINFSTG